MVSFAFENIKRERRDLEISFKRKLVIYERMGKELIYRIFKDNFIFNWVYYRKAVAQR